MVDDRVERSVERIERKRARARAWYVRNRERVNAKRREEYAQDMSVIRQSSDVHVIPEFFEKFSTLRTYLDGLLYLGERNPVDGVVYPGVDRRVPSVRVCESLERMRVLVGPVDVPSPPMFLRLSPVGQATPHQAHDDSSMGEWTLVVYLNRQEHCQGGTSIVEHVEGWGETPLSDEQCETWRKDTCDPSKWVVKRMIPMVSNTGVVFPSKYFHRSEPIGGFGSTPHDARLVLVGFFNNKEDTCKE